METIIYNEQLSEEEKLTKLKRAKGGSWYKGWKPYCMNCSSCVRMEQKQYGFKCSNCQNMVGWDLTRLAESPLNKSKFRINVPNNKFSFSEL